MPLDYSEAYNNSGVGLFKKGEMEKASGEFDKAIKIQRNNHAAWNNRGCVLYKLDRMREAIACFEESSVMMPTTVAMSNKGFSLLSLDLLTDALQTFERSLRINETPEAYNNKGIVLERMRKYDDALVAFNEALRIAPQFNDATENARRMNLRAGGAEKPAEKKPQEPSPPGEEVVGGKDKGSSILAQVSEAYLREKRKSELEAMCESLGLNPRGTRADLIVRILKAKGQMGKK
jgi:tetratricopeptide (TPR) repeat protein